MQSVEIEIEVFRDFGASPDVDDEQRAEERLVGPPFESQLFAIHNDRHRTLFLKRPDHELPIPQPRFRLCEPGDTSVVRGKMIHVHQRIRNGSIVSITVTHKIPREFQRRASFREHACLAREKLAADSLNPFRFRLDIFGLDDVLHVTPHERELGFAGFLWNDLGRLQRPDAERGCCLF